MVTEPLPRREHLRSRTGGSSIALVLPSAVRRTRAVLAASGWEVRSAILAAVEWVRANEALCVRFFVLGVAAVAGLAVVLFRRLIFPAKFSYDADTIRRLATEGNPGHAIDDSFVNVASLYHLVGLQSHEVLAGLVGYVAALITLFVALKMRDFQINGPGLVACLLTVLASAVYLGTYSKDLFVVPISLMVLMMAPGLKRELVLLLGLVAYAEIFRGYWYLVAAFYVVYRVVDLLVKRRAVLVVLPLLALVLAAVAFPLLLGQSSDFARADTNQWRVGSPDAATMITNPIALPGIAGAIVNTVLVFLTLIVPVPLLVRGGAYYISIGICFLALWGTFALGLTRVRGRGLALRVVALLLAFLTTQALFEPDYGSVLRHLTPLLPLLCFVALTPRGVDAHLLHVERGPGAGRVDRGFGVQRWRAL